MLECTKINILIPLENKSYLTYDKIHETSRDMINSDVNSVDWFEKCFKDKPIESTYQMSGSRLLRDDKYKIRRFMLNSAMRSSVGLQHNENSLYSLCGLDIKFQIKKIYLLFTKSKIAFLHIEIITSDISDDKARAFINAFSQINSNHPTFEYVKKLSRDTEIVEKISLKKIVKRIIDIQSYITVSLYEDRAFPYFQITMIGSCDDNKMKFFDSIQALSKRGSVKEISENAIYNGREDYISRFVGNRMVGIYGDTSLCENSDLKFLTDIGNGLIKTATENYTTVYAFLISLRLILNDSSLTEADYKYLIDAPMNLSDEDNIRELFEKCTWNAGWNLKEQMALFKEKRDTEDFRHELKKHGDAIKDISDGVELISKDVGYIANFVRTELSDFIKKEKTVFNQAQNRNSDEAIGSFVKNTSEHIDQKLASMDNDDIDKERQKLSDLFGDKWQYIMKTSQTSLVSSAVLLHRCSNIITPDFDWSGVCICCTAALEAELRRVFFDGLMDFMVANYGEPSNKNADEIYKFWPDVLLSIPNYKFKNSHNGELKRIERFTMGSLPFLFGNIGKLSNNKNIRQNQLIQSELMRKRMTEYLSTIILDYYKPIPLEAFYIGKCADNDLTFQEGCFVWKSEQIRDKFRNKAAHVNVMTEQEAALCYQSIISKQDSYTYNAEVAGVILELFSKVDGSKLNKSLHEKHIKSSRTGLEANMRLGSGEYSIGQIVELGDLEVTTRGVLRGNIIGSTVGASLSKKHLQEIGIYPGQYIGRTIKVKLVRWDENAKKFNAEWIN